jgi:hypothetical protein
MPVIYTNPTPKQSLVQWVFDVAHKTGMQHIENKPSVFGCGFAWLNIEATGVVASYLKLAGWVKVRGQRNTYRAFVSMDIGGQFVSTKIEYCKAFIGVVSDWVDTKEMNGFKRVWFDYQYD